MTKIDLLCESRYRIDRKALRLAIESHLDSRGVKGEAEMSVVIVGERKMKNLHKRYMETEEVTDVLSFPLEDEKTPSGVLLLGDVVVCYPVAVAQAEENGKLVDEEIEFLVLHGVDHLLGIHHEE